LKRGVIAASAGMGGIINLGLDGLYKGRWMGIDIYVSSEVPTSDAGANRAGGILALEQPLTGYEALLARAP